VSDIIQAMKSKALFAPLFKDPTTWRNWEVFLRAIYGLGIKDPQDLALFKACTGRETPPMEQVREAWAIISRRGGKSYITGLNGVFIVTFRDWRPYLSPGERGWVFIIATDRQQAGIIMGYIQGIFHNVKALRGLIEKQTADEILLRNSVGIAVKTASFRGVRGYTIICAILEEIAFWRSEESANPDKEILAAIRPALATVPGSMLIGISTPYSRTGVLFEMFKNYYGQASGPLIWRAPTRVMNPTVSAELIEAALREDPEAARSEWEGEWRSDIAAFIGSDLVEAVTVPGRFELPKIGGVSYYAFADPSGGRQDSFTLAIAHREKSGRLILDVLRERRPPFQPSGVVEEYAGLLKAYGIREVTSDRFAGEWVSEAFRERGIDVRASEFTASEIYLEAQPLITNGTAELLDQKRLAAQLAGLERRARSGGKDLITHYPGGHDDCANAACGALTLASRDEQDGIIFGVVEHDISPE